MSKIVALLNLLLLFVKYNLCASLSFSMSQIKNLIRGTRILVSSPFFWAEFVAQKERVQEDFNVPFKGAPPHPPSITYERQPQHRDHPNAARAAQTLVKFRASLGKTT